MPQRAPGLASSAVTGATCGVLVGSNRLPITVKGITRGHMEQVPAVLEQAQRRCARVVQSDSRRFQALCLEQSVGGLSTSLKSQAHRMHRWVGWPGITRNDLTEADLERVDAALGELKFSTVHLTQDEKYGYYDLTSNGWLWLGMHGLSSEMSHVADWKQYVAINQRFANAIVAQYQPGQTIWLHDYQLMLVPQMIREQLPHAAIGFFLHIPFPSKTAFANIPHSAEILEGLLGADYISVQTLDYLANFLDTLRNSSLRPLKVHRDDGSMLWKGRQLVAAANPISVNRDEIEGHVRASQVQATARELRANWGDKTVFLGVDRLDLTKGLTQKVVAFRALLRSRRDAGMDPTALKLVQITPSTREDLDTYRALRQELEALVRDVHKEFGPDVLDVRFESLTTADVVAHYLAMDHYFCNPIADGMNLTPKEAVVARTEAHRLRLKIARLPGTIILSRQAGAARELVDAILTNAYDPEGEVLQGLLTALETSPKDQRRMMVNLNQAIRDNALWVEDNLRGIEQVSALVRDAREISPDEAVPAVIERIKTWPGKVVYFLSLEAMLEYVDSPRQANVNEDVLALVEALAARPNSEVHVVSSGSRDGLLRTGIQHLRVGLHAEHGLWSRRLGASDWTMMDVNTDWIDSAREIFERFQRELPGSIIEGKEDGKDGTLAFHYFQVSDRVHAESVVKRLRSELEASLDEKTLEISEGEHSVEVRPIKLNKERILRLVSADDATLCVMIGNQSSDEGLAKRVQGLKNSAVVAVGSAMARADVRLADVGEAQDLLRDVLWA